MDKKTILLVTDFSYPAKGRNYFREDVELSIFLRKFFNVYVSHISDIENILDVVDAILIRNTGPQSSHRTELMKLKERRDLIVFNDLSGRGDQIGKYHLVELFESGFPVIPTYTTIESVRPSDRYLLKPLQGADSCGIKMGAGDEIRALFCQNMLIQPFIDFQYEVSFYFVGNRYHYSLYAPNPQKRWELESYSASMEEIDFAQKLIAWNTCKYGIQRVDACRTRDGKLLLMELEDYNPFLSLELLKPSVKEHFLESLCISLKELIL